QSDDVLLNESMANNLSAVANAGKYPDWIELYNPSPQARSLSGFSLTDDLLVPNKFQCPAGTTLPARAYLVVWCDNTIKGSGLHSGFGLNSGGQTVALFVSSANGWILKDAVRFGPQVADLSIGRDTSSNWN